MNVKKIEKALAAVVARMVTRTASSSRLPGGEKVYGLTEKDLQEALLGAIDYIELGRAVVEALLTEETTDELLEGIRARVRLPWYIPGGIVWGMLDRQLPEAIRGPLLDQLDKLEAGGNGGAQGVR